MTELESSVPSRPQAKLAENDLFIGIPAIATIRPCRLSGWLPESAHDHAPWTRI